MDIGEMPRSEADGAALGENVKRKTVLMRPAKTQCFSPATAMTPVLSFAHKNTS
jgi:hypothetical protein